MFSSGRIDDLLKFRGQKEGNRAQLAEVEKKFRNLAHYESTGEIDATVLPTIPKR